jgi:hypothetical protein
MILTWQGRWARKGQDWSSGLRLSWELKFPRNNNESGTLVPLFYSFKDF